MKKLVAIIVLLIVLVACGQKEAFKTKEDCLAKNPNAHCMFNNCDSKSENKQSAETFCNSNLTKAWFAA